MGKAPDIFLLILLAWGAYSGFRKGFVLEIFSLGSFFVAMIGSIKLLDKLSQFYATWYGNLGDILPYLLFVLLFILIVIGFSLVGKVFRQLIHLTLLGGLDKLAGACLGMFKWAFFVSSFLWFANLLQLTLPTHAIKEATLLPMIQPFAPRFIAWVATWWPMLQEWLKQPHIPSHNPHSL